MRAIIIYQPGAPSMLQLKERQQPIAGAGEVLIKVHAAGVNRPDIAQRKGNYAAPPGAPKEIPGLEVAGEIEAIGEGVDRWKVGDKVCALIAGGGYAEYVVAPAGQCLPVPAGWDFIQACTLPETVFTVWHNVFQRGHLQPGEHLLVHGGSSGIGITAVQLAVAAGSKAYATAGTDAKCAAVMALGATLCVNYRTTDFVEALRGEGIDVILDMVGGDYIPKNINLLREEGRLVFINVMRGHKEMLDALAVMQKRLTITGSTLRSRDLKFKAALAADVEKHVWPWIEQGKFKPVIYKVFPLGEAAAAHQLMESSEHVGKIVLQVI
ncbi:putative PIG3 family NAD(P)H quinone oxidoreductase [Chitinophaga dinghuensis]|uniref:Putative PIG3 family NAD(P)H quinone oxidoreductase n=1 Tax=Chitinophaga dinghuensis TaxID=1539050 RepID=A0A327WB28_9BACT|nr:NAD(P)H-quinone oxidoreductase [Chitinophaga dinghuensis]RAJ87957.1 putative PIG3 family NAD(P)H quinone oxidoreductase [Chitinophaga dinghuensis]